MATNKIEHQTNQVTINVNDSKVATFNSDVAVGGVLSLNVQITDAETFFLTDEGTQNLTDLINSALTQAEALAPKPMPPVDPTAPTEAV